MTNQPKDNDLNTQYRKELLETKDPTLYEKRMNIKTRWHRLQLYKIMNKPLNIKQDTP
jgi:hypothetical protein